MTRLRNRKGWLTAEALRAGELEQWARDTARGRVIVQLEHVVETDPDVLPMPWLVSSRVESTDSTLTYRCFRLDAARRKFTELKSKHSPS